VEFKKTKQMITREKERQTKKQTLNYREQTNSCQRGGEGGKWIGWMMGFKKYPCCGEHWGLYVSVETLNCTAETNIILYVN